MATFLSDTFAGSGNLEAHTANSGGQWVKVGSGIYTLGTSDFYCSSSGVATSYYHPSTPGNADLALQFTLNAKTILANSNAFIAGRANSAMTTLYRAGYDQPSNSWYIQKIVSGTITSLGNFAQTIVANTNYVVKFTIIGSTLTLFINDTQIIQATDTAITTAGLVGFMGQSFPSASSSTTGLHYSTLTAADTTGGSTTYSVTAPNKAINGLASAAFTLNATGLATNAVVTPSDGGAGGTFTPATVTLSAGATATATFTYTPATSGNKTISFTNNASLTDPTSVTLPVLTAIAITNTALYYSPANWYSDGTGSMQANNVKAASTYIQPLHPNCYMDIIFTGTQLVLPLDLTANTAVASPSIRAVVDNIKYDISLTKGTNTLITVVSGLSNTTHTCRLYLLGMSTNDNRFNGTQAFKMAAIGIDSGATVSQVTPKSKSILIGGDSQVEYGPLDAGGNDPSFAFARFVGEAIGEYGIVGFSGSGYLNSYNSGTPTFPNSFPFYYTGKPRTLPAFDYVLINLGTNDAPSADITTTVTSSLQMVRAALPNAIIFVNIPFAQTRASQIRAGFNAFGDSKSYLIDFGAEGARGFGGGATYQSNDGTHLTQTSQALFAAKEIKEIYSRISGIAAFGNGSLSL